MAKARDKIMMKLQINYLLILIGILFLSTTEVNSQQLYVGANYHPHDDKNREKSILLDKNYKGNFTIAPYEPEFIEFK